MAHLQPPGIAFMVAGEIHVQLLLEDQEDCFLPGWSYLSGGMEERKSALLLLQHQSGARLFILERHNDDGEWAPLPYPVPADLDTRDSAAVRAAISRIGPWADELSRTQAARLTPQPPGIEFDPADEAMSALLFEYRDIISPGALD